MSISVAEAIKRGWLKDEPQPTRQRKPYVPALVKRLSPICSRYGWQCALVRVLCATPQSPQNTAQTCARYNAVAIWCGARVECLGLIVEVKEWSDEQVVARLEELETHDAKANIR